MKALQQTGLPWIPLVAVMAWAHIAAARDLPEIPYACQATTAEARSALILVQANDLAEALLVAKRSKAVALNGAVVEAMDVVECIDPTKQTFSDKTFQGQFNNMER